MNAIEYLERARVDELAAELAAQGFSVRREADLDGMRYDLLAERPDGKRVVIEVMTHGRKHSPPLAQLREWAARHGIDDFRVSVVQPPRPIEADVEGLELKLWSVLNDDPPPELDDLPGAARVTEVHSVDVNRLTVLAGRVEVEGSAVVEVEIEHDGGGARDGVTFGADFPFEFELTLGPDLAVVRAVVRVDISSWFVD